MSEPCNVRFALLYVLINFYLADILAIYCLSITLSLSRESLFYDRLWAFALILDKQTARFHSLYGFFFFFLRFRRQYFGPFPYSYHFSLAKEVVFTNYPKYFPAATSSPTCKRFCQFPRDECEQHDLAMGICRFENHVTIQKCATKTCIPSGVS